jgi:hypothetical protein
MNMTTSTRQIGGVTIVDVSGRIVLGEESATVRDVISDLLSRGYKHICSILAPSITSTAGPRFFGRCFRERAEARGRTKASRPQ